MQASYAEGDLVLSRCRSEWFYRATWAYELHLSMTSCDPSSTRRRRLQPPVYKHTLYKTYFSNNVPIVDILIGASALLNVVCLVQSKRSHQPYTV